MHAGARVGRLSFYPIDIASALAWAPAHIARGIAFGASAALAEAVSAPGCQRSVASAIPAAAQSTTMASGETFQRVSSKNAAVAIAKSIPEKMALIQTGE